ncbi:protein-glutamine gamma-glutamyltransferase [Bacillus sp. B15-48]|uniref:protein-glutamine gamma-glutamyltransferase n=1 Tax=Bacillus sp. B15-48 TaxID=1548601 RepID=UPI001940189C|nr:protein-glutamine gamma-glutamyltransferase [Bacillus sp. B15-48]MBM4764303.1 protein-glutamine gamma-glutamyltransferase [Bacillus sp. B15-48]
MIRIVTGSISFPIESLQGLQKNIYLELEASHEIFDYVSDLELLFELRLRENIVKSSYALNESGVTFTSFRYANFNPNYWVKSSSGFLLRPDVLPSDAIRDIFRNGSMYGFECSTAIIILFYKAVLDSIRESAFNYLFNGLLVWNWNADSDLIIITRRGDRFIIGDVVYFNNPDYRETIWRGENAVVLGNGKYYGHGFGIRTAQGMIDTLNTLRRPGATRSAYLLKQHSRLNVRHLYRYARR